MFLAKVGGKFTYAKKFGEKIDAAEKWICGCIFVGLFLFFLVGPFFIFSNLKSIAEYNLVTDATLEFTLDIKDFSVDEKYEFPLFTVSNPLSMDALTDKTFRNRSFDDWPETKFFDYDQVQIVKMKNGSETEWALSKDSRALLQDLLERAAQGDTDVSIYAQLTYSFERPVRIQRDYSNIVVIGT
jgi:hypothetical protein